MYTKSIPTEIQSAITNGYSINIKRYLIRGWSILQENGGSFVGFTSIVLGSGFLLSLIPIVGFIVSLVISAPLNAGLFIVAFKIFQGKPVVFNDFFKGFNNSNFIQIFLASLVITVFTLIGFILFYIPGIYLSVVYLFTIPLIVEKKMDFWQAMETSRKLVNKQWFSVFTLLLALGTLNLLGNSSQGGQEFRKTDKNRRTRQEVKKEKNFLDEKLE